MTIRLLSVGALLLTGLLAVFLLALALGASGAVAQEKKNCPAGFNWVRLSGIGCVQEQLPSHGKIGYDGTSICEDGYSGTYERRATTDGQQAPGTPYTSFAYLEECTSTAVGAGVIGGGAFSGTAGDVAEEIYDGGGGPSNSDLALVGVGCGFGFGLATWGAFVLGSPVGAGVWGGPRVPGATQAQTLDRMIAESRKRLELLKRQKAEAQRDYKAAVKLLGFYQYHYWTGSIPRWMAVGGLSALAVLTMGGVTVFAKIVVGGTLYTFTIMNTSWPPPQDEAARMIEKFRSNVLSAGSRTAGIEAQIKSEEHRLLQLEGQKLFSTHKN